MEYFRINGDYSESFIPKCVIEYEILPHLRELYIEEYKQNMKKVNIEFEKRFICFESWYSSNRVNNYIVNKKIVSIYIFYNDLQLKNVDDIYDELQYRYDGSTNGPMPIVFNVRVDPYQYFSRFGERTGISQQYNFPHKSDKKVLRDMIRVTHDSMLAHNRHIHIYTNISSVIRNIKSRTEIVAELPINY